MLFLDNRIQMQVTTRDQALGNEIESRHVKESHLATHHHRETRDHTHHRTKTSRPHEAVITTNLLAQEQAYLAH